MKTILATAASSLLLLCGTVRADTLDVPGDFATIQAAIVAAQDGDVILVQPGIWPEALDTLGKSITLTGAGGSAVTTIDATGHDTSVIRAVSGTILIEGFTVTGGKGSETGATNRFGGGIYLLSPVAAVVRGCRIAGNDVLSGSSGSSGGGAYALGAPAAVFTDCDFEDNHAPMYGGGLYGGIATDCRFEGNSAFVGGGYYNGGYPASPVHCTFVGNHADTAGGCYVFNAAISRLSNCTFLGNTATTTASAAIVFGMGQPYQGGIAENCVFAGNPSGDGVALLFTQNEIFSYKVVSGCTLVGDRADGKQFTNCILWDGAAPASALATLSSCDIEGGWNGNGAGNIDADPLFAAPLVHDYHLLPGSPCFNRGQAPGFGEVTDLDGQPRTQAGATDIGADELTSDCNANGGPDYADIESGSSLDANGNGVPDECEGTWTDLGNALAGSNGVPQLQGSGSLLPIHPVTLILSKAKKSGTTTLVLGASIVNVPFKGGVLVPAATVLVPGLHITFSGSLFVTALWPAGIPSGFSVIFQHWITDAAGPHGFAASNGLAGTPP